MAVRAPDFMFERRLYDRYSLTLGEGATSVVMDDDSMKNVLSNRDPLDSERFVMLISQAEKQEFDRWFQVDIRRSGFFIYEPVFNPTPRDQFYVLGRIRNSSVLSQRLIQPEMEGPRVWEVELEVEFYSRRPLRAPLELYPNISNLNVTELIHVPRNNRSRYDSLYQDPIPLDWSGAIRVSNLETTRPPSFTMPDINETSSMIIRYRTPITLAGMPLTVGGTAGEYEFTTQGIIFYRSVGTSYVSTFQNGVFSEREEIWQRRGLEQVDAMDRISGTGWEETRNPSLTNNLGFIREGQGTRLDDLNVLLLSRGLTGAEMDAIIAAQEF